MLLTLESQSKGSSVHIFTGPDKGRVFVSKRDSEVSFPKLNVFSLKGFTLRCLVFSYCRVTSPFLDGIRENLGAPAVLTGQMLSRQFSKPFEGTLLQILS